MPPGPPLGQKGAAYADVASANSTLNTLMPGRQKSWMTNTPVQPSPRRPRPQNAGALQPRQSRGPTQQPQQQSQAGQRSQPEPQPDPQPQARPMPPQPQQVPSTPANVLPSPAPSDDVPSPAALSNYKDSPNPQTVSLAAVSRRPSNTAGTLAWDPLPTHSSVRANPDPGAPNPQAGGTEPTSPEQAVLGVLAQPVQSPIAMPPPDLPASNHAGPFPGESIAVDLSLDSPDLEWRPNSTGAQNPPSKKRRIEAISTNNMFAELATAIDRRIAQVGGKEKLTPDVEGPRFQLLKDACAQGDVFYLHLHSLYCLWSLDPNSLPPLLARDLSATHRGFFIVETVLKKNSDFQQDNLMWCAAFPRSTFHADDPEGVQKVAHFLAGLSEYWPTLSPASFNRHYPFLVDELLGQLHCYSLTMQNILFTASRRRLGIQDGALGSQVQRLFHLDQKQHMDEQGSFRQLVLSDDPKVMENRNLILIRAYRDIWSKAKAEQEGLAEKNQRRQEQLEQLHKQREDLRRQKQLHQEEYQRQALAAQRDAQQHLLRQQWQQSQSPFQQQQMRNNQAILHVQQQSQLLSQFQLGQVQAEMYQGPPGQQQQIFPQWAQSQMQGGTENHARRPSLNTQQQIAQRAAQFGPQSHASGVFSGAGSPRVNPNSFVPQNTASQLNYLPQNLILSSNISPSPAMSGTAQTQYQYSLPQQQQVLQAQNQLRLGPWPASTPSPTTAQSPQMSTMQTNNPSVSPRMGGQQSWSSPQTRASDQLQRMQPQTVELQMGQPHMVQQLTGQQQIRLQQLRQQQMRQLRAGQQMAQQRVQPKTRLIPAPGHVIDRSEHPHSHHEKKSFLMSLHQASARSPDRTRRDGDASERYYQSVRSLAVQPFRLVFYHEIPFEVSPEQFSRLCRQKALPHHRSGAQNQTQASLPVREYGDGSLRFRVRCCRLRSDEKLIQEPAWVTKDMMWPEHIFVHLNEQKLIIRRGTHNGKDLPIELTDFILSGTNRLKVAVPRAGPTAADKGNNVFYLAIEVIEVASHAVLLRRVETTNRADREETLAKIRTRLNAVPDEDDEIAVIDRTGSTARELSIGLTDPFSASIFTTPARGATCVHLECFDLETWLNTRPTKQQIKCGHKDVCTCPKRLEPTEPDKWKCPICFEDARPSSLRVDSFLEDVRKELATRNILHTKSILVAADGTWRPVDEPDDDDDGDDDEGSDGDGAANAVRRSMSALRRSAGPNNYYASVERGRAPAEVIELD